MNERNQVLPSEWPQQLAGAHSLQHGSASVTSESVVNGGTDHESHKVPDTLQYEHNFVSAILDTVGALVVVLDNLGRIVFFNKAFAQLTGYSISQFKGHLACEILAPEELERVKAVFNDLCAGNFPSTAENFLIGRDGRRHLIAWSNTAIPGSNGTVEYVIATGIDITARRQAEEARQEILTRFESTFENIAVGMAHGSPDGRWLRVNQKLCEVLGYTKAELLSKKSSEITHPHDVAVSSAKLNELLSGKIESYTLEKRYIRKNGEIVWVNFTGSAIRNSSGNPDYLIDCIVDISRRKRAETALADTESRLQAVINQATAVIFLKDRKGRRLLVNEEYLRAFGFPSRDEVLGRTDFELFPPAVAENLRANDLRVWATGIPHTVEEEIARPDGPRTYITKKFLISYGDGRPYALCGIGTDITANKQVGEAVRQSEEHLRRVLNNLYVFVGLLSPDGTLVEANRAPLEAAGLTLEDVRGRKFWDCYWWNYSPVVQNQLRDAIERAVDGESSRYDVEVRMAGGKMMSIDFMLAPMRDREGRISHLIASAVDITDRKLLERELLEISSREQRRIGQDLHDDLCQRLTGTELVAHTLALDLRARNAPEADKADKVAGYIRDAIAHTRLLSQGLVPVSVATDGLITALRELAVNSEEMFRIKCELICGVTRRVICPDAATHLYRIAQESISNAVRHGKASHITITLEPQETRVRMVIADNGSGIPYPLPKSAGMGLRIMQYRAGMIGAALDVHPRRNGGTEVACTFPHEL